MDAWVYLFSKFTHEALLFEALALFLGLFGYAIFFLIRKRKYGVAGKEVPSNIMKVYLAQLMGDAEDIRTQLFGLLGKGEATSRLMASLQFQADSGGAPTAGTGATAAGTAGVATQLVQDPKLTEKLKELEKKLAEQSGALDAVLNEKMKLEEEFASASRPSGGGETGPLQEKVKQLEAQLAEYAIIEDDLANLKRLQKENKTLKQQISDAGGTVPAAGEESPAASPPEPKAAAPSPSAAAEAVEAANAPLADQPADFEALVNVVEKNLADAAKSDTVDPNAAKPASEMKLESGPVSETKPDEKSEEQLQADFEKMLNS